MGTIRNPLTGLGARSPLAMMLGLRLRSGATHGALRVRPERGLTGLETAIVLIAFVVVASVLGYTILSAGVFSTEKSKESVYAGLEGAQRGLRVTGEIRATGVNATEFVQDSVEWEWDPTNNVTFTLDTTDYKDGGSSARLDIASGFTTGQIAHHHLTGTVNATSYYTTGFWIKPSAAVPAGRLQFRLYSDTSGSCSGTLNTINLPALTANTWQQVRMKLTNPSELSSIQCVGLIAASDPGTLTVRLDLIELPAEAQVLEIPIALAVSSGSLDLTKTTDTDSDGLLADESTSVHRVTISYTDELQHVEDLAWSVTAYGKDDGDAILEPNEQWLLTVQTKGLLPLPTINTTFTITIKPDQGAPLVITRKLPPKMDSVMILR